MPSMPMTYAAPRPQPAAWQSAPALAGAPTKSPVARGVMAESAPTKFVMPSPESLGVTTNLQPAPSQPAKAQVDWQAIQVRLDRLGVLRYRQTPMSGLVRVELLLPTGDPAKAQPVHAQAQTEGAAAILALDAAEAWARKR